MERPLNMRDIDQNPTPPVLGQRLQDARRSAGLTQQDVANQMEMARTTVVAIEKGERRIADSELIRFARLYKRPVSDLVGRSAPTEGFQSLFRTAGVLIEELQRRAEDYVELERIAAAPLARNYPAVIESLRGTVDQTAADIAASERNRLGLGDGPAANLRDRLETEVGVRVFHFPMPSKIAGLFACNQDLGACIGVNSSHPRDRRNWSLAHEYAHFLMHRYQAEVTVLSKPRSATAKERMADGFAENFLMPASGLNRRFSEVHRASERGATIGDIVSLANLYQVSVQSMTLRLEGLRRVPAGTWERLVAEGLEVRKAQRLLGIDANPPLDDLFPKRYVRLAARAFQQGDISEGQLCAFLRTDRVSARACVEAVQHAIQCEREGEVSDIEVDFLQPVGSR
jgi:Zn-dependent peptidase ImmA (M78 family)/DNA-binding XRE family transcriptional regulator